MSRGATRSNRGFLSRLDRLSPEDELIGIGTIALVSGCAAAFASGEATGLSWWDAILRFGLGAIVALAATRSSRATWVLLTGVGAAFGQWPMAIPAGLALVLTLVSFAVGRRHPVIGALVGGLALQTLLRMPAQWFFGFESILASLAIIPVVVVGAVGSYRDSSPRVAQVVRRSAFGLGAIGLLVVGLGMLSVFVGRGPAQAAVDDARRGARATSDGNIEDGVANLRRAQSGFETASHRFRAEWAQPARMVPILSQHLRALDVAAAEGVRMTAAARRAAESSGIDELVVDGKVDISRLQQTETSLRRAAQALESSQEPLAAIQNRWLLPPLADPLKEVSAELNDAVATAHTAADAATFVPQLLGAERPMRYLIMFGSPAEARELGGFMSSWVLAEVEDGEIDQIASGRARDLRDLTGNADRIRDSVPNHFIRLNPWRFPENFTGMPSIDQVAPAVIAMLPALERAPIDGVVYADPFALAAMVEHTGPIDLPAGADPRAPGTGTAAPRAFDAPDVADWILRDQYFVFEKAPDRHAYLAAMLETTLTALSDSGLPTATTLRNLFLPVVRSGRLQMATSDPEINEFLATVGLAEPFGPDPADPTMDFMAILTSNTAPNKLDTWLQRDIDYEATVAPDGTLTAAVTVTLSNEANLDLPPAILGQEFEGVQPGENRPTVVLYTPHEITGAWVNGERRPPGAARDGVLWRYSLTETIPVGGTGEVVFGLTGRLPVDPDGLDAYTLSLAHQPLVRPDEVSIRVNHPAGERSADLTLERDTVVRFDPDGAPRFD